VVGSLPLLRLRLGWHCRNPHRDGEWLEGMESGQKFIFLQVVIRIVMESGWKSVSEAKVLYLFGLDQVFPPEN
jgi:hypothetical protein